MESGHGTDLMGVLEKEGTYKNSVQHGLWISSKQI